MPGHPTEKPGDDAGAHETASSPGARAAAGRPRRSALEGVRVLEIGEMVSAPYCAKLLGDLGADVTKVEGPDGDPARRIGPFPRTGSMADTSETGDRECSALFLYLNTSKRGVCLDLDSAEDRDLLQQLIRRSHILVDNRPSVLAQLGLDPAALRQLAPGLVQVSITPYGKSGPRSKDRGDELTLLHAGGLANLLPTRSADIDRAPVRLGGYQVGYHGGLVAALAATAALYGSRFTQGTADGAEIDVSLQEVVLSLMGPTVTGARYHGLTWSRVPDRPPAMGRMQARDGYVILNAFDDHHFAQLRELMGNPEWCAGDDWLSMAYRAEHLLEIAPQIEAWVAQQSKADLHRDAGTRGIPIGPIDDAAGVLENPQFRARGYFTEVEHARAGRLDYPGWPYQMSVTPAAVSRPAPLLGQHNEEIEAESTRKPPDAEARAGGPSDRPRLPLEGIRVLELCWVWAGPYCGAVLASLGAEVIKVEGHRRTDLTRRSVVWPLADPRPSKVPPNQGMAFNQVNVNKRSLTLDLNQPTGRALAHRLAEQCDVVVDNMRPGALDKHGLGHADLVKLRQDLIVASSSGRGCQGPEREYLGYAMIHQGIGGGAHITGYPDDHPSHSGGDVDLMNALALAFSIVAALHHREQTGEGQIIDFSQCEGVTSLLGESLLGYQMTGEVPQRDGNRHSFLAPHNVYRAWGVDRWIAIEIHDDDEFQRLAAAIDQPDLANDEKFATAAARKRHEAELDQILGAWTRTRDRDWMVRQLAKAGVHVAPSRTAADLYADPHLRQRGAFVEVDHPELGPIELVGMPFRFTGLALPTEPAPALGRDNETILSELLGLSEQEITQLRTEGVIL